MDNLTHSLVGMMMSRCGLEAWSKERGFTAMMVLAANVPDVDAYPFFTSQVDYLDIHRGYTHALIMAPVMALLPILIVKAITRTRPTFYSWLCCTLVVLSHLALDWTNIYGIRMLLPFSDKWMRLDITNVIDPLIWGFLLLCWAVPAMLALVTSEIGSGKSTGARRAWAWIALLGLLGYEGARWSSHERVVSTLNSLLYMDEPAKNVYAFPENYLGLLRWRGVVEGEGFFYEMPVSASGDFNMRDAKVDYTARKSPTIDAAKTTHTFQVFEKFNQVPFWIISPLVDVTRVELLDLRFGTVARPGLAATAMVEPDGRIQDVRLGFSR
jgi:inner membrane protein